MHYERLTIPEDALFPIRKQLYHSSEPGYFVFRGFITQDFVDHIVAFWSSLGNRGHEPSAGKPAFSDGCPNRVQGPDEHGNATYYQFLWNRPLDEATYAVAFAVHLLRGRVEGRMPFHEIFPYAGRGGTFRVVLTRNGRDIVRPHQDWVGENFDPRRLQATLFLSEKGPDYQGRGFVFQDNHGQDVSFGTDVEIQRGDLALWRYNNVHRVDDVETGPDQLGMLRLLFPPEEIRPRLSPRETVRRAVVSAVARNSFLMERVRPVYKRLRGR